MVGYRTPKRDLLPKLLLSTVHEQDTFSFPEYRLKHQAMTMFHMLLTSSKECDPT